MKLDEIARLAGVSRTTASYVINGKAKQYRVSDKTVEKVMAVVREHNYHPNAVAAGLRAGRTRSIGLVIPDLAKKAQRDMLGCKLRTEIILNALFYRRAKVRPHQSEQLPQFSPHRESMLKMHQAYRWCLLIERYKARG